MIYLPPELWVIIFSNLCAVDLVILCKVCKLFNKIIWDELTDYKHKESRIYQYIYTKNNHNINDMLYYLAKHNEVENVKALIRLGANDYGSGLYGAGISGNLDLISYFRKLSDDNGMLACGLVKGRHKELLLSLLEGKI